ncbi:MAG: AI-2E family transporter [Bacillota bacterium]|nr:AI-2E family transporter [Bacillota bacterium]
MDKNLKQKFILIAFAVTLFAILMNLGEVLSLVGQIFDLTLPLLAGLLLAFVLRVPANGIERRIRSLFSKARRKPSRSLLHWISLLLTLLIFSGVIFLIYTVAIPELSKTVKSIVVLVDENWPSWLAALENLLQAHEIESGLISEWISSLDIRELLAKATSSAGILIGSIANVATATVSGIATALISCIIAFYVLMSRDTLARQSKKFIFAYLKPARARQLCHVAEVVQSSYSKFLSGQCLEAVILGILIYISFSIFSLPYAGLVALVTAVCALIPYVGAFFACGFAVFLSLLVSPEKALICLVVYLAVQFVESQLIYPHVVGTSVGLSPLWTLAASLVGGSLFGILGMIFCIPLVAAFYLLVREAVNRRLSDRDIQI